MKMLSVNPASPKRENICRAPPPNNNLHFNFHHPREDEITSAVSSADAFSRTETPLAPAATIAAGFDTNTPHFPDHPCWVPCCALFDLPV